MRIEENHCGSFELHAESSTGLHQEIGTEGLKKKIRGLARVRTPFLCFSSCLNHTRKKKPIHKLKPNKKTRKRDSVTQKIDENEREKKDGKANEKSC